MLQSIAWQATDKLVRGQFVLFDGLGRARGATNSRSPRPQHPQRHDDGTAIRAGLDRHLHAERLA